MNNANASDGVRNSGLVGYWKLNGDCLDYSGGENHATNHNVDFFASAGDSKGSEAAAFNGIDSFLEVADSESLRLGSSDFAVSVWVHTEQAMRDYLGDIAAKYDPASRNGFNFSLLNITGAALGHSNYRNVFFGIDDGRIDSEWTDCGRPPNNLCSFGMAVFKGDLYATTFEWEKDQRGHVYRYGGGQEWIDCGSPDASTTAHAMAIYNDSLYVSTARYDGVGSHIRKGASPNINPGGNIFRYEGGKEWEFCGKLANPETGESDAVASIIVFDGRLYATSLYKEGRGLYRYEGGTEWSYCGSQEGHRLTNIIAFNGYLLGTSLDSGRGISQYNGGRDFTWLGNPEAATQTYGLMTYEGQLYTSTWPTSDVYRYDGGQNWISCGGLDEEKESMGMMTYNGKLYVGSLPAARVYRFDGNNNWTSTGQLDTTPESELEDEFPMRRAWQMVLFQGKLFCSVLPSGHIKSLEAGKSVTYDHDLPAGWRHLVALRNGDRLELYIDGKRVSQSTTFNASDYTLANNRPLKIGLGQHDYFAGRMREFRIYNRALSENEIGALGKQK
jgi:hypothetical protein